MFTTFPALHQGGIAGHDIIFITPHCRKHQSLARHLMATFSLCLGLILVLLTMGSNAVTAPSSQCAYVNAYFSKGPLVSSLVPSISSKCLAAYNSIFISTGIPTSAICIADCQSLYALLAECQGTTTANAIAMYYCGQVNGQYCSALQDSALANVVRTACSNATSCSNSCMTAISALEQNSGCCQFFVLNGPKVLCGQQPIAPCSTIFNSNPSAPSSECAYLLYNNYQAAAFTPSVNATCRAAANYAISNICTTPECQSLYNLVANCYGESTAELSVVGCGKPLNNSQNCSSLYSNYTLLNAVGISCINSTYCTPSCLAAIAALEQYGGCWCAANS